jgi:HK97 family phage major capsid protein/HK97 family phage prohead protease
MPDAPPNVSRPPRDGYRAISWSAELREDAERSPRLVGHFARFNTFTEIDSAIEGRFLERITPGAFSRTLKNNGDRIRVLFQHGKDPTLGEQPIAALTALREDETGPYYEADLLDGVPPLILDGLRRGVYGVSYRFQVVREDWNPNPNTKDAAVKARNPAGLPERTIREATVFEFGPVTFPADRGADVMVRSLSDLMSLRNLTADPAHLRELVNSIDPAALPAGPEAQPHSVPETRETVEPPPTPKPERTSTLDEYVTRDEKSSRVTELKQALARQAVEYPGVLPADAQVRWDSDSAELETLERDIAAWDSRQARLAAYAADETKTERAYDPPNVFARKSESDIYDLDAVWSRSRSPEQRHQVLRDNAMRSVEQAVFPHPAMSGSRPDEARAQIANLLDYRDTRDGELAQRVLATGSPVYRRYFNKLIAGQNLTPEESRAAMAVGVSATGGAAVPYYFDPTIVPIGAYTSVNPYRAACRVEQIVGSNVWQAVASGAVSAVRALEAAVAVEAAPTFEAPSITVKRVQTLITYSIEMEQDRADLASEMARLIQEGKDTEEENSFTIGNGSDPAPYGLMAPHASVNGFWTVVHTAGAGCAIGDLYVVESTVLLRHRMNAAWFMSRAAIRAMQALEIDSGQLFGGQYYARTGYPDLTPSGNTGLRLLNYPIWEVPSGPYSAAADIVIAAFGDPKQYVIVDRVGMNVEVIPHIFTGAVPTGQRALYAMWRNSARAFGAVGAACTGGVRLANAS